MTFCLVEDVVRCFISHSASYKIFGWSVGDAPEDSSSGV